MQRHHQDRRTILRWDGGDEPLGRGSQYGEGPLACVPQFWARLGWDACLEHRGIVGRLALGELEIGFADAVEGREGIWTAAVPSTCQRNLESIEAAPRHIDQQFVAVAKMSVGRGRTYPCPSRSFREGKPGGSLLRDQFQCRAYQGLFQIAMVIAARTRTSALPGPAHVKSLY